MLSILRWVWQSRRNVMRERHVVLMSRYAGYQTPRADENQSLVGVRPR